MSGIAKIGPDLFPYRSLSEHARRDDPNKLFYSREPNAEKVACPFAAAEGEVVLGNTIQLATIHHLIEVPDGRIKGSITTGNAHKRYDFSCCAHLPPAERIDLFDQRAKSYSHKIHAATCFYCHFPKKVDPDYTPEKETSDSKPEPVIV